MTVLYEHGIDPHKEIVLLSADEGQPMIRCFPGTYVDMINRDPGGLRDITIALLDESAFDCTVVDCSFSSSVPLTKKLFDTHIKECLWQGGHTMLLRRDPWWYVIHCFVDDRAVSSPLGQVGEVVLRLGYITQGATLRDYWKRMGNILTHRDIRPFPKHFFSLQFFQQTLQKPSFHVLYLFEQSITLVTREYGMYKDCQSLNIGRGMIRDMCRDEGIDFAALHTDESRVSKAILLQFYEFFFDQCTRRRGGLVSPGYDCIVVSEQTVSRDMMDMLQRYMTECTGGYVLPFRTSSSLRHDLTQFREYSYDALIAASFAPGWLAKSFCL